MRLFLLLIFCLLINKPFVFAQKDTVALKTGSIKYFNAYPDTQSKIIDSNKFGNNNGPEINIAVKKNIKSKNAIFYLLVCLLLVLGIIKLLFSRYFSTLFRVFLNTSLRQGQLTDQLLIVKLPSLVFNLFFVIVTGLYVYFLFRYFNWLPPDGFWITILYCVIIVATIYIIKFLFLKSIGWISGYKSEANVYIFIVFLINKVMAVFLVPFVIIIACSDSYLAWISSLLSLAGIFLLLVLRFVRSYSLIRFNIKFNRFHFLIYMFSAEILPILLAYKAVVSFLIKNS